MFTIRKASRFLMTSPFTHLLPSLLNLLCPHIPDAPPWTKKKQSQRMLIPLPNSKSSPILEFGLVEGCERLCGFLEMEVPEVVRFPRGMRGECLWRGSKGMRMGRFGGRWGVWDGELVWGALLELWGWWLGGGGGKERVGGREKR